MPTGIARRGSLAVLFVSSLAAATRAGVQRPFFAGLGDLPGGVNSGTGLGISSSGAFVAGSSSSAFSHNPRFGTGFEAFLWSASDGMVGLGDLPGGYRIDFVESYAWGVSADGATVVGQGLSDVGEEAVVWTPSAGIVGLGSLFGRGHISALTSVSDDGTVAAGWLCCDPAYQAIRVTNFDTVTLLGTLGGAFVTSFALAVSADGSTIVGASPSPESSPPSTSGEAFRWTERRGMIGLGFLPGGLAISEAYGVSADGAVVVGRSNSAQGSLHAFRWTEVDGMIGMGDLPGGTFASIAYAVSADGARIVGQGRTAAGDEAFIWGEVIGMQRLQDRLEARGIRLDGWVLQAARSITPDGRTMTGWGLNPGGDTEAWIASLGEPSDLDMDGDVDGSDLGLLLAAWGGSGAADLNEDGLVDAADLGLLLAAWTG